MLQTCSSSRGQFRLACREDSNKWVRRVFSKPRTDDIDTPQITQTPSSITLPANYVHKPYLTTPRDQHRTPRPLSTQPHTLPHPPRLAPLHQTHNYHPPIDKPHTLPRRRRRRRILPRHMKMAPQARQDPISVRAWPLRLCCRGS